MTAEEKEIRDAERKIFADVRRAKRLSMKRRESMTPEEYEKYMKEIRKKIRDMGFKLVPSLR